MNKNKIDEFVKNVVTLGESLSGHLTKREMVFIATLPFLKKEGAILEIGSFKGKSTIVLSKSAEKVSAKKQIHACDTFELSQETDPDGDPLILFDTFKQNLQKHHVLEQVTIHKMSSQKLAENWKLPLKVLWIDGDHSYQGAKQDFDNFKKFLSPGSIICFHDTLHKFDGPIRVFTEDVLLSPEFSCCGLTGSIAWALYNGDKPLSKNIWLKKINLAKKLQSLSILILKHTKGIPYSNIVYKIKRSLIPHDTICPSKWLSTIEKVT